MYVFLVSAVVAYPNGWISSCNQNGATVPDNFPGQNYEGASATINCAGHKCTLTSSLPGGFKGFVISSSNNKLQHDHHGKRGYNSYCATHKNRQSKTSVEVTLESNKRTTLYAIIVAFINHAHQYIIAKSVTHVPLFSGHVYIIGAGPGGLAAARHAVLQGRNVTVYEQGPLLSEQFWQSPIRDTYLQTILGSGLANVTNSTDILYNPLAHPSPSLVKMVGGQQMINGAVFAPGSAEDLADSVGVMVSDASNAQNIAATFVDTVPAHVIGRPSNFTKLMHRCTAPDCQNYYLATFNLDNDVKRAAIAYDLPENVTIEAKTTVLSVSDKSIRIENKPSVELQDDDIVILAAGALSSPQLLGITSFCGYNHYYTLEFEKNQSEWKSFAANTQVFSYPDEDEYELNYGMSSANGNLSIEFIINMTMKPDKKECYTVGQSPPAVPEGFLSHAWHYMGTVNHSQLLVSGYSRVFIGDASALSKPFNCHTSMPAAAAGVLAVESGTNGLQMPYTDSFDVKGRLDWVVPLLFILGVGCLIDGIFAHVLQWYKSHYVLMSLGTVLITAAILYVVINNDHSPMNATAAGRTHRTIGKVTIVFLWLQVLGGIMLKVNDNTTLINWSKEYRKKVGKSHRRSGWLVLLLVAATLSAAVAAKSALQTYGSSVFAFTVVLLVFLVIAVGVSVINTTSDWLPLSIALVSSAWPSNPRYELFL